MRHTDWGELDVGVRLAIEARTGPVLAARTATAGLNSQLAVVLGTGTGTVFVKGLPVDHPGAIRQEREAMINPYVRAVAPQLLWHQQAAGWDLLAFEYIGGARHADYRPGSPDLPRVIGAMHRLAAIGCPDLPVKQARQRWAAYVDRQPDLDLLDGDALLHTDFNPLNILLSPDRVWIIDWAWPTRGAAFIDAACFLLRAMAAGHSASQAEALAARCPGWRQAPPAAIDVFALASVRLYNEIARNDPQPFKQQLAAVASDWACHRTHGARPEQHRTPGGLSDAPVNRLLSATLALLNQAAELALRRRSEVEDGARTVFGITHIHVLTDGDLNTVGF